MERLKELEFHENSARTAWSAGAYIGTGDLHDPTATSRRPSWSACPPSRLPGTAGVHPKDNAPRSWVGRYQEIEEYLRTAECVSMEIAHRNFATLHAAAGRTRRQDGLEDRCPRRLPRFLESYKTEIAAYELDKLLKMDMVPPTVERQLQGIKGAAQLWVEDVVDATDPTSHRTRVDRPLGNQLVRMTMFDNLIGNRERNAQTCSAMRVEPDSARSFPSVRDGTELPQS